MTPVATAHNACSFFIVRLKAEADRLLRASFPGHDPGPRKWLRFVVGLIDTANGYLASAAAPGVSDADASKLITDAETLSNGAYQCLMHAAGADANQMPHQIVAPFQRWVECLKINNTLFFRAEHLPNYEIATFDLKKSIMAMNNPSQSLLDSQAKIEWPVLRVTVPGQAMGMLPHFAVVAHELGHAIQDRIQIEMKPFQVEQNECIAAITARLTKNNGSFGLNERLRTSEILIRWINELKADAVGHYMVGPAFFFALCGFLELSGQTYGIAWTHPPTTLRRKLLIKHLSLNTPSFSDVLLSEAGLRLEETSNSPHIAICPSGDALFNELLKPMGLTDAAICTELVELINSIADHVYDQTKKEIENTCKNDIYTVSALKEDIERHLKPLISLIPPIEFEENSRKKASTLASIMNVGWVALLTSIEKIPSPANAVGSVTAVKMERLHELLLKAVELAEARLLWDEHK